MSSPALPTQRPAAGPRLGIFGGAFDPPHTAHMALARAAIVQLRLDRLHILPTGGAWHKKRALSSAADRLAMCRLAFAGIAGVDVDDREIRRAGDTFTIDTITELRAEHPDASFFLLMGADQALALQSWHRWQEIVQETTISVAARADAQSAGARFDSQLSALGFIPRRVLLALPAASTSATEIRQRAARGEALDQLVSPAVARYIADHHLYRTA